MKAKLELILYLNLWVCDTQRGEREGLPERGSSGSGLTGLRSASHGNHGLKQASWVEAV